MLMHPFVPRAFHVQIGTASAGSWSGVSSGGITRVACTERQQRSGGKWAPGHGVTLNDVLPLRAQWGGGDGSVVMAASDEQQIGQWGVDQRDTVERGAE